MPARRRGRLVPGGHPRPGTANTKPGDCSVWLIEGQPGHGYTETLFFAGFQAPANNLTRREEGVVGTGS